MTTADTDPVFMLPVLPVGVLILLGALSVVQVFLVARCF